MKCKNCKTDIDNRGNCPWGCNQYPEAAKTMNNSEHTLDCICAWCEVARQHAERLAHRVSNHLPGNACICGAYGESECGCVNVDWRSRRELAMQTALEYCISTLKSQHIAKPGIVDAIRQTEMIRDAGNYRGGI